MQDEALHNKVLASGWLREKPPQFQAALLREARIVLFETTSYTHHIGDHPGGFYGIINGSFGVITQNPVIGTVMGHIMRSGDWFGQRPMVVGKSRSLAFQALESSSVLYVSLQAVEKITQSVAEARWHFASLAEHNLETTIRIVSDLLIRSSDKRIAAVLLRIAGIAEEDDPKGQYVCTLRQSDLAELANVSRHVVNATMKNFEGSGWIKVGYGKISILNAGALWSFLEEE